MSGEAAIAPPVAQASLRREGSTVCHVEKVTLDKGHDGLGIHVRGGTDFPFLKTKDITDPGIFIVHVGEGSYADRDGRLKVGDKIVSVNGENVERVTRDEFVRLFARAVEDDIVLDVIHDAAVKILCADKKRELELRPRDCMDGDRASATLIDTTCLAVPSQEQLPGWTANGIKIIPDESQESVSPTRPASSGATSISLTSDLDDGDFESICSLTSSGEMPPRPESSLDEAIRNLRALDEGDRPSAAGGKRFFAMESLQEVDEFAEEDDTVSDDLNDCTTILDGEEEDVARIPELENDTASVGRLSRLNYYEDNDDEDEELEEFHSSGGSLDSASDDELRRCRESVFPEYRDMSPFQCPTADFVSPSKTDDSRDSSGTPETVVARSAWSADRSATPARAVRRILEPETASLFAAVGKASCSDGIAATSSLACQAETAATAMDVASHVSLPTHDVASPEVTPLEITPPFTESSTVEAEMMAQEAMTSQTTNLAPLTPRLTSPELSREEVESVRRRLIDQEEDLERRRREEEEQKANAGFWTLLCVSGIVAIAAVMMTRQWVIARNPT